MIVLAGVGGHALEVFDELKGILTEEELNKLICFDEDPSKNQFREKFRVMHTLEELKSVISQPFKFYLGIGSSAIRKKMVGMLNQIGGIHASIRSKGATVSDFANGDFDSMSLSFIGPDSTIGPGSLINVGAHIHHECRLGEFVEVGPGSLVLGNSKIGDLTQLGAGVIVLPGISIGSNCIIGAGSVVTKDIKSGSTAFGVPCKIKVS